MTNTNDAASAADAAANESPHPRGSMGLIATGVVATLAAAVVTTFVAAVLRAGGIDFEIPEGEEALPLSAFAFMTSLFALLGVAMAVAFLRWNGRPARRFVATSVVLTVLSCVPVAISGAEASTVASLIGLHVVAAGVMIPALARALGRRSGEWSPAGD